MWVMDTNSLLVSAKIVLFLLLVLLLSFNFEDQKCVSKEKKLQKSKDDNVHLISKPIHLCVWLNSFVISQSLQSFLFSIFYGPT